MNELSGSFENATSVPDKTRFRTTIVSLFNEMWREDHDSEPPVLQNDTVLLETGFDSMAFAVLVVRLDDEFGFDPFTISDNSIYPRTFAEFVNFYEQNAPA
jgi:acyl carrier protein